ncbi:MAG: IS3 family transposase [Patescibacteria group bacterium]
MVERPGRRTFTAEFKRRIVEEADACTTPGEVGALLRRHGLYSSHLADWRMQNRLGVLGGLGPRRGPKPTRNPLARRVAQLEREKARLQKQLTRAKIVIAVQKKGLGVAGDPADPPQRRRERLMPTAFALAREIGSAPACAALGIPRATLYRRRRTAAAPPPTRTAPRATPARALQPAEREAVLAELHSPRFVDQAPREIYATLLDEGRYLCSVRTMYRLLRAHNELRERRDQLRHPTYAKPELLATRPNQVWSWDISRLLGPVKWTYFHLYVILDIFSRYVVGWMVAQRETAQLAQQLIYETCEKQAIRPGMVTVHADRGTSMTSRPVALLLADLGVTKTHSRPHVSNDNPFSESQFKTLKYRPEFPDRFGCVEDARAFCGPFFAWYNTEHHHTGLGLLTPEMVHYGRGPHVLAQRQLVLSAAWQEHPERFVRRPPVPAQPPTAVWINPPPLQLPPVSAADEESQ